MMKKNGQFTQSIKKSIVSAAGAFQGLVESETVWTLLDRNIMKTPILSEYQR